LDEIRQEIKEYLRTNWGIYSIIAALFALGVLAGALAVRGLDETQRQALNQFFSAYLEHYRVTGTIDPGAAFRQSLRLNFQYLFLIWIFGLLIYGYPFVAALTVVRGFSVGFTVGFLVERAALRGVLFAAGSVLPHNLLIIPAFIVMAVTGFSLSWHRFRSRLTKRPISLRERIGSYTITIFLVGLALFLGILVEAYISPVFVKLLIPVIAASAESFY